MSSRQPCSHSNTLRQTGRCANALAGHGVSRSPFLDRQVEKNADSFAPRRSACAGVGVAATDRLAHQPLALPLPHFRRIAAILDIRSAHDKTMSRRSSERDLSSLKNAAERDKHATLCRRTTPVEMTGPAHYKIRTRDFGRDMLPLGSSERRD